MSIEHITRFRCENCGCVEEFAPDGRAVPVNRTAPSSADATAEDIARVLAPVESADPALSSRAVSVTIGGGVRER